jgi:hypothetical protein
MRLSRPIQALCCSVVTFAAISAQSAELLPHRAVYDLKLADAVETNAISGIDGRMVYEFSGSACEGYTVRFRYVTRFDTEASSRLIDERSETFEAGDGSSFRFSTQSYVDEQLDRETEGSATVEEDGIRVTLEKPEQSETNVGAALFPTSHLIDLIGRAQRSETFYEEHIYDGSDGGSKVMTTTVVIGKRAEVAGDDAERLVLEDKDIDGYWPVDMAYFDLEGEGGEEMPSYHISFKLHESGVTRDLVMDYGDFAIAGRLVELDMLEPAQDDCAE